MMSEAKLDVSGTSDAGDVTEEDEKEEGDVENEEGEEEEEEEENEKDNAQDVEASEADGIVPSSGKGSNNDLIPIVSESGGENTMKDMVPPISVTTPIVNQVTSPSSLAARMSKNRSLRPSSFSPHSANGSFLGRTDTQNSRASMSSRNGGERRNSVYAESANDNFQKYADLLVTKRHTEWHLEKTQQTMEKEPVQFSQEEVNKAGLLIYEDIFEDVKHAVSRKLMRNTKIGIKEILTSNNKHVWDALHVPIENRAMRVPHTQAIKKNILEGISKHEKQLHFQKEFFPDSKSIESRVGESVHAAQNHPFDLAIERVLNGCMKARQKEVDALWWREMEKTMKRMPDEPTRIELVINCMGFWPAEVSSIPFHVEDPQLLTYRFVRLDEVTLNEVPPDASTDSSRHYIYQHRIIGTQSGKTTLKDTQNDKSWVVSVLTMHQKAKYDDTRRKQALVIASRKSTWWNKDAPEYNRVWKYRAKREANETRHHGPDDPNLEAHGTSGSIPTSTGGRGRPILRRKHSNRPDLAHKDLFEIMQPLMVDTNISPRKKVYAEEAIDYIVKAGRSLDTWQGPKTPLRCCVHYGLVDIVELLLARHADPNDANKDHVSVLHLAVWENQRRIIDQLLKYKANPQSTDSEGQTPLFFADHPEVCQTLLAYRASVNFLNKRKQSPLHLACRAGLKPVIEWLVAKGNAELIHVKDGFGASAAYYGLQAGLKEDYLVKVGVKPRR